MSTMNRLALGLFAALALVPACAANSDKTADLVAEEESSALTLAPRGVDVLGTIAYGTATTDLLYKNPPRYRAFAFDAQPGDAVDLWVRSNADALAYLTDASFRIVAQNDDADASTADAHITKTLTSAGTYYVVFREYNLRTSYFNIDLQGRSPVFACAADADCVAVPISDCCPKGEQIAVNEGYTQQYFDTHLCRLARVCPAYTETRVPRCDAKSHACAMVPRTCAQNVLCAVYSHFDNRACTCVKNPACGGLAGLACPSDYSKCVDDPGDTCDPAHGGADCAGVCVR